MITIYHNPRCSKSREALAAVEQFAAQHQTSVKIVKYLETPLDIAQLQQLYQQLGPAMLRENEDEYKELKLAQADEQTVLAAVAAHPILLQRPIVELNQHARIARPLQGLEQWLINAHTRDELA